MAKQKRKRKDRHFAVFPFSIIQLNGAIMATNKRKETATEKKNEKDAHLLVRMVITMVSMLKAMKAKLAMDYYKITIVNDPAGKLGQANAKGQITRISFHRGLLGKIVQWTASRATDVKSSLRSGTRTASTTGQTAEESQVKYQDIPFVAFVKRQVDRILEAPAYICNVKTSRHYGQCFYKAVFKDGQIEIQIQNWALGQFVEKTGKIGSPHWEHRPFFTIREKQVDELLAQGNRQKTTTKRGEKISDSVDAKDLKGPAKKYRKAKENRTAFMNAALAMAQLLMFTDGNGVIKERHVIGYYIEATKRPNRHTKVVGMIYGNNEGRFQVKTLEDKQLKTVYTLPAQAGNASDWEVDGKKLSYLLKDFVLGKLKNSRKGVRGAPEVAFGKTSSKKKEVETHFSKPVHELFERDGKTFVLTNETKRLVFDTHITGGNRKTIAKQMKLRTRRESRIELGDALMGTTKAGMFWKMVLSIGPFSNAETPGRQKSEGFGSLDPQFRNGVKTKARRGAGGWTERGLLNPKASIKAGAIGPRACKQSCDCFLCETPKGLEQGELQDLFEGQNGLLRAVGAYNYNAPVLIPVRSRADVEPLGFGKAGADLDQDARQVELQNTIESHAVNMNDTYPMWMEADSWPAKNGYTLGLNLVSRPCPEGYELKPGWTDDDQENVNFVEIVAYPTHVGLESDYNDV